VLAQLKRLGGSPSRVRRRLAGGGCRAHRRGRDAGLRPNRDPGQQRAVFSRTPLPRSARRTGTGPLGVNLKGPFCSPAGRGDHAAPGPGQDPQPGRTSGDHDLGRVPALLGVEGGPDRAHPGLARRSPGGAGQRHRAGGGALAEGAPPEERERAIRRIPLGRSAARRTSFAPRCICSRTTSSPARCCRWTAGSASSPDYYEGHVNNPGLPDRSDSAYSGRILCGGADTAQCHEHRQCLIRPGPPIARVSVKPALFAGSFANNAG